MKAFVVALVLYAQQAFAGGGGGGGDNVLNEVHDFGDGTKAPIRSENTLTMDLNKTTQNSVTFKVYVKNNDLDRAINEMHGDLTLKLAKKPTVDQTIALGFYFGEKPEIKEANRRR
jgi:hypothetical protein